MSTQARFITADLTAWTTDEQFDLVTLSFFQAPFEFPRAETLQSAASLVAPGGHLLAVSHAAAPSWTTNEQMAQHSFPSPESELVALDLDPEQWNILRAEIAERPITDPDGNPATLQDTVVFVQRRGSVILHLGLVPEEFRLSIEQRVNQSRFDNLMMIR